MVAADPLTAHRRCRREQTHQPEMLTVLATAPKPLLVSAVTQVQNVYINLYIYVFSSYAVGVSALCARFVVHRAPPNGAGISLCTARARYFVREREWSGEFSCVPARVDRKTGCDSRRAVRAAGDSVVGAASRRHWATTIGTHERPEELARSLARKRARCGKVRATYTYGKCMCQCVRCVHRMCLCSSRNYVNTLAISTTPSAPAWATLMCDLQATKL